MNFSESPSSPELPSDPIAHASDPLGDRPAPPLTESSAPTDPATLDPTALGLAIPAPDPAKPLATHEEKLRLLRDHKLVGELQASIRGAKLKDGRRAVRPRDYDDALQVTLLAMVKAPIPKAPDEITPYCKQIAENIALKWAGALASKPDANAVSLDDGKRAEYVQARAGNPEAILGARQVIVELLARTAGWGAHRGWLRSSIMDEAQHAEIAAAAGVATETVTKTLSLRRQELRGAAIKDLLVFVTGIGCTKVVVNNMILRSSLVSASPLGPLQGLLPLSVACPLAAILALAVFALLAWRTRARWGAIVTALGSAAAFAMYMEWWGNNPYERAWATVSDVDTDTQALLLYGAQALVVVGAGSLLASAARKAYGIKGLVGVAAGVPIAAVLASALWSGEFTRNWIVRAMIEAIFMWQIPLLMLYAIVAWWGRRPTVSGVVEGIAVAPATT